MRTNTATNRSDVLAGWVKAIGRTLDAAGCDSAALLAEAGHLEQLLAAAERGGLDGLRGEFGDRRDEADPSCEAPIREAVNRNRRRHSGPELAKVRLGDVRAHRVPDQPVFVTKLVVDAQQVGVHRRGGLTSIPPLGMTDRSDTRQGYQRGGT